MTFLPIVERELRVAARKRGTFWLRVCAAAVALLIGSAFMLLSLFPFGGRMLMGGPLFGILTWLSLAAVLSAGLFFTSDCLSEEKREGTLGFLFLTDLRGYDVVLGKLLTTSLRGFFALLAIFPVLAVTFMMGGVQVDFFWKTLLALVNALFFSLATGMFVSAVSRDSQKAMGGTLFLLLLFLAGGPAADGLIAYFGGRGYEPLLSLSSPGYAFAAADGWSPVFWKSLLISHVIGWMFLGLACGLIPRTWQVRATKTPAKLSRWSSWWRYGGARRRIKLRRKFLDANPVMWLACRERWQSLSVWMVSIVLLATVVALWVLEAPREFWAIWNYFGGLVVLIFYLWTATQACRFFVEARHSGLIELLLAAPLNSREIVLGPWRALRRLFGWPVLIFLAAQFLVAVLAHWATFSRLTVATSGGRTSMSGGMELLSGGVIAVAGVVVVLANLVALSWFGLWMGMTSRSSNLAALKTILFVQIIPWMVITFASTMLVYYVLLAGGFGFMGQPSSLMSRWFPLGMTVVPTVLTLAKDFLFWKWSRWKLFSSFREMAVQAVSPVRVSMPPTLARPVATPPVIKP